MSVGSEVEKEACRRIAIDIIAEKLRILPTEVKGDMYLDEKYRKIAMEATRETSIVFMTRPDMTVSELLEQIR